MASYLARRRSLLGAIVGLAASAWLLPTGLGMAQQPRDLVVFATASLKNAIDDIKTQYERETGKHITISYAASPTLAKQIKAARRYLHFRRSRLDELSGRAQAHQTGEPHRPARQQYSSDRTGQQYAVNDDRIKLSARVTARQWPAGNG